MSRPRPATAPRRRPLPIVALVPRDDGTRDDEHDADDRETSEPVPTPSAADSRALVAAGRLRHKASAKARAAEQAVRARRAAPAPAGLPAVGDQDHAPAAVQAAVQPPGPPAKAPAPPGPPSVPTEPPEPATAVVRLVTTPTSEEVRRLAVEARLKWSPDGASAWIEPRVEHRPRFDGSPADASLRAEEAAARRRDVARAEVKAATEREVARAEWSRTLAEAVAKFEPDFDRAEAEVAKKARGHGPTVCVSAKFKFLHPEPRRD